MNARHGAPNSLRDGFVPSNLILTSHKWMLLCSPQIPQSEGSKSAAVGTYVGSGNADSMFGSSRGTTFCDDRGVIDVRIAIMIDDSIGS